MDRPNIVLGETKKTEIKPHTHTATDKHMRRDMCAKYSNICARAQGWKAPPPPWYGPRVMGGLRFKNSENPKEILTCGSKVVKFLWKY